MWTQDEVIAGDPLLTHDVLPLQCRVFGLFKERP